MYIIHNTYVNTHTPFLFLLLFPFPFLISFLRIFPHQKTYPQKFLVSIRLNKALVLFLWVCLVEPISSPRLPLPAPAAVVA